MEGSSGGHTTTVFNKILIPVITTVLGATAIYFLGFNNKKGGSGRTDMEQMLISKDATIKAWRSFVTTQNVYYKNEKSLEEEFSQKMTELKKQTQNLGDYVPLFKDFEKDVERERKKTTLDVENILKDSDIDRDFVSMLNRILDDSKDYDRKLSTFFDEITSIMKSGGDDVGKRFQDKIQKYSTEEEKMGDRIVNQAEGIAKVLADRYNQAFDLNELQAYVELKKEKDKIKDEPVKPNPQDDGPGPGPAPVDPNQPQNEPSVQNTNQVEPTVSLLAGQWDMTGGTLELSRDGEMYWSFGAKGYTSGDWKLSNGTITMNATNPDTKKTAVIVGYISVFKKTSFTLTFNSTPKEVYNFIKKVDY